MLSKCANPYCSAPFLYLHRGKLFRIERRSPLSNAEPVAFEKIPPLSIEYFWLCEKCSEHLTVVRAETGIRVAPLDSKRIRLAS